jgi:hypothetical protein
MGGLVVLISVINNANPNNWSGQAAVIKLYLLWWLGDERLISVI